MYLIYMDELFRIFQVGLEAAFYSYKHHQFVCELSQVNGLKNWKDSST